MNNDKKAEMIKSLVDTRDWLLVKLENCEKQISMSKGSLRSHNRVIALKQDSGSNESFLNIVDRKLNSYNFSADSFDTPRYERKYAEQIASELAPREGCSYVVMFDVDAMKNQRAQLLESIASFNESIDKGELF